MRLLTVHRFQYKFACITKREQITSANTRRFFDWYWYRNTSTQSFGVYFCKIDASKISLSVRDDFLEVLEPHLFVRWAADPRVCSILTKRELTDPEHEVERASPVSQVFFKGEIDTDSRGGRMDASWELDNSPSTGRKGQNALIVSRSGDGRTGLGANRWVICESCPDHGTPPWPTPSRARASAVAIIPWFAHCVMVLPISGLISTSLPWTREWGLLYFLELGGVERGGGGGASDSSWYRLEGWNDGW